MLTGVGITATTAPATRAPATSAPAVVDQEEEEVAPTVVPPVQTSPEVDEDEIVPVVRRRTGKARIVSAPTSHPRPVSKKARVRRKAVQGRGGKTDDEDLIEVEDGDSSAQSGTDEDGESEVGNDLMCDGGLSGVDGKGCKCTKKSPVCLETPEDRKKVPKDKKGRRLRCTECERLIIMEGTIWRRVRSRMRTTELEDSDYLHDTVIQEMDVAAGSVAKKRKRGGRQLARRVMHPDLHGSHAMAYDRRRRPIKREELKVVEHEEVVEDDEVENLGARSVGRSDQEGPRPKRTKK